jgi:type II secretion system protein G
MKLPRKRGGFTLIELLIVVAIIAILAAIAVPNFLEAQVRAKVSRAKTEMRTLDVALTAYHVDHLEYPPWTLPILGDIHPCSWRFHRLTTPIAYITGIPKDPFSINREMEETSHGGTLPQWDTYDYVNFIPPGAAGASDHKSLWGHWWRLNSFGPDYYNQWGGSRGDWDGITVAAFDQFPNYVYDPTNGSVSWGDILRMGPRCDQSTTPYHPLEQLPQ